MAKDLSGAQTSMSPSNPVNNPRPSNQRGRNIFPQSYLHLTTERYGEYSPFFWAKCERGDVQILNSSHNLHTYTLKSPMVSDVTMTKSYFKIPMQAIYPRNWEKMFTIPTQGDDVPADTRAVLDLHRLIKNVSDWIIGYNNDIYGVRLIRCFLLLEALCSHGSLFSKFNMHFDTVVEYNDEYMSYDQFMDKYFYPDLVRHAKELETGIYGDDDSFFVPYPVDASSNFIEVSPRRFFELVRSNPDRLSDSWENYNLGGNFRLVKFYSEHNPHINIEPIICYQLALAQFATNDFVDFIYSAQLYRDNMQSLYYESIGTPTFMYNGVIFQYDVFSAKLFNDLINCIAPNDDTITSALDYFLNLFSYVPSLRYGDYFTGAKPQPLAVGEYSAKVNNNEVSAIDITRSIQMQRLLHRVNMVGRKIGDYISGIFGGRLPEASKDVPIFLAHQKFQISGFETENTAEVQFNPDLPNSITSHLRSADSRHAFEIEIEEPCYIIGVSSYESMRVYSKTLDRFAFHHDRYDDFIPEMQYIGDQDINLLELDSSKHDRPFGYALRYMEYKQRYSYASGGFIENLPSWAFITDNSDGNPSYDNITPDYIRSSPSEFDRFYKSLNGYSLGSYFHFIVAHMNHSEPVRMMDYQPEILK